MYTMNPISTDNTKPPVIEINDLSFSFGSHEVLSHVSITVAKGDYLAIVGPNGAGKTTLLKLMMKVLQPNAGTIRIFGEPVEHFTNWSRIGYVPQHVQRIDLSFPVTVREVVLMGTYGKRGLFRTITTEDRKNADDALRKVGLFEFRDTMIGALSGGQTQRVFIARALVTNPDILILDEPTAGVDLAAQASLYALLRSINNDGGVTLLVISHDIEVITKESDHLAFIDKELIYYPNPLTFTKEGAPFLHGHDH